MRTKVLTAVGILALVVLLAVIAGAGRRSSGTTGQDSTPSVSTAPTAGAVTGLRVAYRGAGRGLAADGLTPVGFEPTCEGAVQAATAYAAHLEDLAGQGRPARKGLQKTLDTILTGQDPSLTAARKGAHAAVTPPVTSHPEWGGFRLDDCTAGTSARVSLFTCITIARVGEWADVPGAACGTSIYTLLWVGDPADWKISGIATVEGDDRGKDPGTVEERGTFEWPNPLPAADRRRLLAAAGSSWTEYTDAPR